MSTHTTPSLPPNHRTELGVQFLAELMQATMEHQDQSAFQQAQQTYCENLRPWLEPSDGPPNPRAIFSLLEVCTFDETRDNVTMELSPEAEALCHAWLRRHTI
jgi:glucan biosynthesis protein